MTYDRDAIRGFHVETRDTPEGRLELRGYESSADEYTVFFNGEELLHYVNGEITSAPIRSADVREASYVALDMIENVPGLIHPQPEGDA